MAKIMQESHIGSVTPLPVKGMACERVLVMTRLHGFKITDKTALAAHRVDRAALLIKITHSCAWQLLVAGVFNGTYKILL